MKRRYKIGLLLLALAVFAVWLEPTRVVWGWLRSEAFYQGRPTSYWRNEIVQWSFPMESVKSCTSYARKRTILEEILAQLTGRTNNTWPQLFDGDPDGQPVLEAMTSDSSELVRDWARVGLERMEGRRDDRGPFKLFRNRTNDQKKS